MVLDMVVSGGRAVAVERCSALAWTAARHLGMTCGTNCVFETGCLISWTGLGEGRAFDRRPVHWATDESPPTQFTLTLGALQQAAHNCSDTQILFQIRRFGNEFADVEFRQSSAFAV